MTLLGCEILIYQCLQKHCQWDVYTKHNNDHNVGSLDVKEKDNHWLPVFIYFMKLISKLIWYTSTKALILYDQTVNVYLMMKN